MGGERRRDKNINYFIVQISKEGFLLREEVHDITGWGVKGKHYELEKIE